MAIRDGRAIHRRTPLVSLPQRRQAEGQITQRYDCIKDLQLFIEQARTSEGAHELLKYCPRMEFRRIMKYLDSLGYHSQIDYTYIRQLIHLAAKNYEIKTDQPYDWQIDDSELEQRAGSSSEQRGHSSNSSTDGRSDVSPKRSPNAVCEKLEKVVQRINGSLQIDSNGKMQNGDSVF
jgi:hypothetical protein